MKAVFFAVSIFVAGFFLVNQTGCATDTPGATDTLGSYSTMVDGPPDKVTSAAEKAADDLKLTDIVSDSTKIDGKLIAKNAQGDTIRINIEQAGENVSKVTIHVGATGDEAVSKQLVERIKSHMSWM